MSDFLDMDLSTIKNYVKESKQDKEFEYQINTSANMLANISYLEIVNLIVKKCDIFSFVDTINPSDKKKINMDYVIKFVLNVVNVIKNIFLDCISHNPNTILNFKIHSKINPHYSYLRAGNPTWIRYDNETNFFFIAFLYHPKCTHAHMNKSYTLLTSDATIIDLFDELIARTRLPLEIIINGKKDCDNGLIDKHYVQEIEISKINNFEMILTEFRNIRQQFIDVKYE